MLGAMALEASLSLLEEVGMNNVSHALNERMTHLQEGLLRIPGITLHSPLDPQRRAGIVNFTLAGHQQAELFNRLTAEQVVCAQRGAGIRLSPHFYTTDRVLDETLGLLSQLADG
jgi:cysteine desulfurase/selenocysteine lyase